jgi:hypothetical protein
VDEKKRHQHQDMGLNPIIDSGLFGLWGEKHAQLVSARDHAKLEQFGRFNRLHGHPDDFFDHVHANDVRSHDRRMKVECLRDCWD